jgi:hypothetical protein
VEVLKAYSHTPERLYDLRKAVEIARRQEPDAPDDDRNEAASRPSRRTLADRLSPEDVQMIIDLRKGGTPTKELAAKFGISTRSVRRLLHKHDARPSDRDQLNWPASPRTYKHHDLGPTQVSISALRGMSGRCVRKGGWLSYVAPFRRDRGAAGFEVLVTGPVVDAAGGVVRRWRLGSGGVGDRGLAAGPAAGHGQVAVDDEGDDDAGGVWVGHPVLLGAEDE